MNRASRLQRERAFGEDFRPLMGLVRRRLDMLASEEMAGDAEWRAEQSRELVQAFEEEIEVLLAKHEIGSSFAEYVRHVVHQGFDGDFDSMDPKPRD